MRALTEAQRHLPEGAGQGLNDSHHVGYGGPCPPIGRHRYFFRLYALDCATLGLERPTRRQLEQAMQGHVLAVAELMGTYRKGDR
jgi:Raf kinase inhibitor-like YbhB/YbcL family protein